MLSGRASRADQNLACLLCSCAGWGMISLSSSTHQALSDVLGYTSIACWLGAQFPQVLENIRNNSCEGLALPFLANWLMGDISNLVGCILTHQLPFQTYLAVYFVFVDCTLVGQYLYYTWKTPSPAIHPRVYSTPRRMSIDRSVSRYRSLSAVASNVAKAAALAAQYEEHAGPPRSRSGRSMHIRTSQDRLPDSSHSRVSRESDDEVDENALSALADSFHSERGHHNRVSWNVDQHAPRDGLRSAFNASHTGLPATRGQSYESLIRGRSLQREAEISEEHPAVDKGTSRSARRGSSMIFFGVWALFSVSMFAGKPTHVAFRGTARSNDVGRVMAAESLNVRSPIPDAYNYPNSNSDRYQTVVFDATFDATSEPSNQRILGRIFAWLCTTLYLTSRLPQIWKNYARKSVEGLSMYLFVFAFLGNVFYVASILSSPSVYLPPPISTDFLKESTPYLLGSAGTLMFDITIVAQSFIYRPKRHKRGLTLDRGMEEESRLLEGDVLANSVDSVNGLARTLSRG